MGLVCVFEEGSFIGVVSSSGSVDDVGAGESVETPKSLRDVARISARDGRSGSS